MTDAMQIASQRKKSYLSAIAKKESEIAEMKELIADLDSFMEFGQALLGKEPDTAREVSRPVAVDAPRADDEEEGWDSDDEPQQQIARVVSQRMG